MSEETNTNTEQAIPDNEDNNRTVSTSDTNTGLLTTDSSAETTETPAEGEETRPAWLPEKFKTPEDLAKSYTELETKMNDIPKAPKEYTWDFTKDLDLQMTDDTTIKAEAEDMFKHLGMTQKQVEGVMGLYKDQLDTISQQVAQQYPKADLEQENANLKSKWGAEYEGRLTAVKQFASKLPAHVLTQPIADTADGLEILYSLMDSGRAPNPIVNAESSMTDQLSLREKIAEMRADPKMKLGQGDPIGDAHRQAIYKLYEKLSG